MSAIHLPQAVELTRVTLDELQPGRCAVVAKLEASPLIEARLNGMGVCVGRTIEMVQHGDPMIVRACGTRIGLAHELARAIRLDACQSDCITPPGS